MRPVSRSISARNSGTSFGPAQIDQKSSQKAVWTMCQTMTAVKIAPDQ